MPTTITAHDVVKNATYTHKEILKQHGFYWNKTERKWQKDGWIPATVVYAALQLGIKIVPITKGILRDMISEWEYDGGNHVNDPEGHDAPVDPSQVYTNDDIAELPPGETVPEDIEKEIPEDVQGMDPPVITAPGLSFYTHPYPDEKFNHGAYLNSRAKHENPIDEWYKNKLIPETPSLGLQFLIGRAIMPEEYVIISIQDYDFTGNDGKNIKGTSVTIYMVNGNNVITGKAKLRVDKPKRKYQ